MKLCKHETKDMKLLACNICGRKKNSNGTVSFGSIEGFAQNATLKAMKKQIQTRVNRLRRTGRV